MTRHNAADNASGWSRRSQGFRRFDGTHADWRTHQPVNAERAPTRLQRLRARLTNLISSSPSERRDIAVFMVGAAWGVMCAIGMLAAWGIHP